MVVINNGLKIKTNTLSQEILKKIKLKLERLKEQLPSDSFGEVVIDIIPSGFWVIDFSVKYSRGHIAVKRFGVNLDLSIDRVIGEMNERLRLWHSQREIETFRLDRSVEHDYYSEIIELIKLKPNGLNVMALDDDPAALSVIQKVFTSLGCNVKTFSAPDDALEELLDKNCDLLILDWNLPYKNGKEFLLEANAKLAEQVKNGIKKAKVPVAICSSLAVKEIDVPRVEYFQFLYPWHKEIPFSSIVSSFEKTMKNLTHQKAGESIEGDIYGAQ